MMKQTIRMLLTLIIALALLAAGLPPAAAETGAEQKRGYIVKLAENRPMPRSFGAAVADPAECLEPIPYADGFYTADSLEEIQALMDAGLVDYAEPNDPVYLMDTTNDPLSDQQWYLETLGIQSAWGGGLDGTGVKVAVVDSGLLTTHEDFVGLNLDGNSKSFITGNADITDTTGHGTFVTGVLAAQHNSVGLKGLVPGANLLVLRCFSGITASTDTIISALSYAIDQKADIINMSFGGTSSSLASSLREVLSRAQEQGILLVAAAGNDGNAYYQYPAALDGVVGVGMVDMTGAVAAQSQKNDSVFVTAPGHGIPGVGYSGNSAYRSSGSGTSYAAPMVSALAAMAKQVNRAIDAPGFERLLRMSATDRGAAGYDTSYGWGTVSASALAAALTRDYAITYECGAGSITQAEFPASYTIGRAAPAVLPTKMTREGWSFTGWYTSAACAGAAVLQVPDNMVGDLTYYAGWVENTDVSLRSLTVQGVEAAGSGPSYTVRLPANSGPVTADDFAVTPVNGGAVVGPITRLDGGTSWSFSVALGGQSETYTVRVVISGTARPQAVAEARSGSAAPASLDGLTPCIPYGTDVSDWFASTDGATAYAVGSHTGAGEAALSGRTLTYTPAAADAGSQVVVRVRAENASFASAGTADVTVTVAALPVSDCTVTPGSAAYDLSNPADLAVTLGLYGNSLVSVSENGSLLPEGTDYAMGELPVVAPISRALTLRAAFLSSLTAGRHMIEFTFSGGRSAATRTVSLALTVTRTHTVTFRGEGAVYDTRAGVADRAATPLPAAPSRSGYTFSGWYTGQNGTGTAFTAATPVTGPLTVYAHWTQSGGGGGDRGGGEAPGQQETEKKEEITLLPLVWSNTYSDVSESNWFYEAVAFVSDRALFRGDTDGNFAPHSTMTRGMLATVLHRLAGEPDADSSGLFTGLEEHAYYARPMAWAVEAGILRGYGDGRLGSGDPITREQLAVILYQYAVLRGYQTELGELSGFRDAEEVGAYSLTAMRWACASGVINGNGAQLLSPKGQANRAEVAQMLTNFCRNVAERAAGTPTGTEAAPSVSLYF